MRSPSARLQNRLILLALWLVFYGSFTLFAPPLLDDADSVHAEVAREMLMRHDFVTLYANGIRYLEKAPLYYWTMAASMKVFGATAAASRLPLALAVLALALALESFGRRAFASSGAGLYAGLITLSSFGIFIFSRINIPDVLVCVLLTAALYVFYVQEQSVPHLRDGFLVAKVGDGLVERGGTSVVLCASFAALLALDVLTKGLIGLVFPVAIVGLYLLVTRGLRGTIAALLCLRPIPGLTVFLAISAPWHVLIALANPGHGHPGGLARVDGHWQVPLPTDGNVHGWAWFYFLNEQLYRYLNLRVPHDYDTSPLWLFYGLIFIWLMPWSAFLPSALARALPLRIAAFRERLRSLTLTPVERTNVFLVVWAMVPLVFFSLSTRQEYYVLPALPPMVLLIAALLANSATTSVSKVADSYLRDHLDEAIATYKLRNTSGGTLSISSDAARELLPGYSTPAERTANTFALSPASSRLADAIWTHMNRSGPLRDRYVAIFLTGSPGSGKTSSTIESTEETATAIISEGMMDNFDFSVRRIQNAVSAGYVPSIRLVYVDDPRTALRRAALRAMKFGRPVAIAHMGQLYTSIPKTVAQLSEYFGPALGVIVFDNSVDGRLPIVVTLDSALHAIREYTSASATEAMLDELDRLRNDGIISDDIYRQFRDPVGAASEISAPHSSGGRRDGSRSRYASYGNSARKDTTGRTSPRAVEALRVCSAVLLAGGILAAFICLFFIFHGSAPKPGADLAALLAPNPADYALSFGHFLDLTGPAMALFRVPLLLTAIALLTGTLGHFAQRRRGLPHAATLALAGGAFLFLLAAHQGLVIFAPTLTSRQLADAVARQSKPEDLIAIHGEYEAGSTLGFYLRRNDIHIVEGRSSNLWYGSFFPDAPKIFETRESIARKWAGPRRIFLWEDPKDSERPELRFAGPVYVIADAGGKRILSNRPSP